MDTRTQRIVAFKKLGEYLRNINSSDPSYQGLYEVIRKSNQTNGWFTDENCLIALKSWGETLDEKSLYKWLEPYQLNVLETKTVGLILAGNIPLVGFHDLLSVLICGHKANVKTSSNDPYLVPFLYRKLIELDAIFENYVEFTSERLTDFDAVIATGSNNAARYFTHYFAHVPHIIRKNRNGIAVLDGTESEEDLQGLANDIVQYFGLGCRSIAKVYLPRGYDLNLLFGALYPHADVLMQNAKFANNYDYNKAVFLMSEFELLDNGFFLLREHDSFGSPVACLHYSYYDCLEDLTTHLTEASNQIQCISSNLGLNQAIPLGKAQQPDLWDYADGVDPIAFLLKL